MYNTYYYDRCDIVRIADLYIRYAILYNIGGFMRKGHGV